MSLIEYLGGYAQLVLVLAGCCGASALVVVRALPGLTGPPRWVALGLLFTAALVLVHLAPGLVGLLTPLAVLLTTAGLVVLCSRFPRARYGELPTAPEGPDPSSWGSWTLALAAAAIVGIHLAAYLSTRLLVPVQGFEALSFDLPTVARWIQSGSIWTTQQFVPQLAGPFEPNTGDLVNLAIVLPWSSDQLVRVAMVPFLLLTGLAVFALARELRAPRAGALLAATALIAAPVMLVEGLVDPTPDSVLFATFSAGLLFLVRHARSASRAELSLAGIGLGLAAGSGWYAIPMVLTVVLLWAITTRIDSGDTRATARRLGFLAAVTLICMMIWPIRNLVASGDLLGAVPPAPALGTGHTIAGYLFDPLLWTAIVPGLWVAFAAVGALLALVVPGSLWTAVRREPPSGSRSAVIALAAGAFALALTYLFIPYSAFGPAGEPVINAVPGSELVPAAIAAAALLGWLVGRANKLAIVIEALALVAVTQATLSVFGDVWLQPPALAVTALAVAIGAVALTLSAEIRRGSARIDPRVFTAATAVLLLLVGAVGGRALQVVYDRERFLGKDPVLDAVLTAPPLADRRVGLAGLWVSGDISPIYPAFGRRLDNQVRFVGATRDRELLRPTSKPRFLALVEGGDYTSLIVGLGPIRDSTSPEANWLREAGWRESAVSPRFVLFEPPGTVPDPATALVPLRALKPPRGSSAQLRSRASALSRRARRQAEKDRRGRR